MGCRAPGRHSASHLGKLIVPPRGDVQFITHWDSQSFYRLSVGDPCIVFDDSPRGALALPVQFAEEHTFAFGFIFGHACGFTPGVDVDLGSVAVMLVFADEGAIIRVL